MSEFQHSSDNQASGGAASSKLDSALARIDQVIDSVSRKLDEQRYEHRTVVEERDAARAELDELRRKYEELQGKADHAADRIEVLIGIVERSFPDLVVAAVEDAGQSQPEGGHEGGHDHGHNHDHHHHDGGNHQPQQHW
jgi:ABC-type transporter Mla subunit MlaD